MQRHATLVATKRAAKFECETRIKRGPKRIGAWQSTHYDWGFAQSDTLRRKPREDLGKPKGGVTRRAVRTTEGREPEGGRKLREGRRDGMEWDWMGLDWMGWD